MSAQIPEPVIFRLPYDLPDNEDVWKDRIRRSYEGTLSNLDDWFRLILAYPMVYVVHAQDRNIYSGRGRYTVYVGETNDIRRRTRNHLHNDAAKRSDWHALVQRLEREPGTVWQYVIGDELFNKSLTLDIENRLMHYLVGVESVSSLNNRRTNAQGNYYTKAEFDRLFDAIWLGLHKQDPELFPSEQIIRDSALFKASPFHELSVEQRDAEESILSSVLPLLEGAGDKDEAPRLIVVQGAAGTGKTVLLSHLFYRLVSDLRGRYDEEVDSDADDEAMVPEGGGSVQGAYILVNHNEQVHVYDQIACKLGLQGKAGEIVMRPTRFINRFSEQTDRGRGIPDKPKGRADIVLIDEAHLLSTQGNQGYSGTNMLLDVLRRSRVVVAVFDEGQTLRTEQRWTKEAMEMFALSNQPGLRSGELEPFRTVRLGEERFLVSRLSLDHQFRMAADEATIAWIEDLVGRANNQDHMDDQDHMADTVKPIPIDRGEVDEHGKVIRKPYDIKVFDSPVELMRAIKEKAMLTPDGVDGQGLSRVTATYDWPYKGGKANDGSPDGMWDVTMHRDESGTWVMGLAPDDCRGYEPETSDEDPSRFCHPWNYQLTAPKTERSLNPNAAWAEEEHTLEEIGSTYTIQGFDLNYAGVIIGPSVTYKNGKVTYLPKLSQNRYATNKRRDDPCNDYAEENLRNELNVLLKRGVHGLYLFAVDPALQRALRQAAAASHKLA